MKVYRIMGLAHPIAGYMPLADITTERGPYFTTDYRDIGRAVKRLGNAYVATVEMTEEEYQALGATSDSEHVFSTQGLS